MLNRKVIRLQNNDYSHKGKYFITINVKGRFCILGEIIDEKMYLSPLGEIVQKWLMKLPEKYDNIKINHSVIMPDHIHFIIEILEYNPQIAYSRRKMLIAKIVGYFKMNSAKEINAKLINSNSSFWQRNYHDHIIRNKHEFYVRVNYMKKNPSNWASSHGKGNS